ncbi:MAG: PqqD family protein [Prevotella sp.]|nr:PqqD family protein [Prevotella sp.]
MKAKPGFNLRTVCGEQIIVAEGKENIDFSNIISMNESSAYLWKNIQGKEFTAETLADLLTEEYEVEREKALADCHTLIRQWQEAGIVE